MLFVVRGTRQCVTHKVAQHKALWYRMAYYKIQKQMNPTNSFWALISVTTSKVCHAWTTDIVWEHFTDPSMFVFRIRDGQTKPCKDFEASSWLCRKKRSSKTDSTVTSGGAEKLWQPVIAQFMIIAACYSSIYDYSSRLWRKKAYSASMIVK